MEKFFHANSNQRKAGLAIQISDKIDFKSRKVTRDKEGYYMLLIDSIEQ